MVDVVGCIPMSRRQGNCQFQLVSSRSERASLIVPPTSSSAVANEVAADVVGAATMIDRVVHHAEVGRVAAERGSLRRPDEDDLVDPFRLSNPCIRDVVRADRIR